jgi:putative PIG3 family NAD(P)H quinone oxidoreductase
VRDVPPPDRPLGGQVAVDVRAAGINFADTLARIGLYQDAPKPPCVVGYEVAGEVAAVGPGVEGIRAGDRVAAGTRFGGYAERVVVPAGQVMPVPAGVDLVDAAALPEVAATVWSTVFMGAALRPGEVLLVHGGGSGIGTMAVQLARHVGATVAVTAGSRRKLEACAALGAEVLVDYARQDFVEEVRAATGGHGADVVLDVVGAPYLARNVDLLATGGRLVLIGLQGGTRAELDLGAVLAKRLSVLGSTLRSRPLADKAAICASVVEHVWPLLAEGRVRPVVHERVPLAEATRAHRAVEASEHVGKVLLVVG